MGAPVARCFEEGLEPLADDLVEECLLGLAALVAGEWRAGGASVALPPGLRGIMRRGHAGPLRKGQASSLAATARNGERQARLLPSGQQEARG